MELLLNTQIYPINMQANVTRKLHFMSGTHAKYSIFMMKVIYFQ